jgi:hypothetical protein
MVHPFAKQPRPDKLNLPLGKIINGNAPIAMAICANARMACPLVPDT